MNIFRELLSLPKVLQKKFTDDVTERYLTTGSLPKDLDDLLNNPENEIHRGVINGAKILFDKHGKNQKELKKYLTGSKSHSWFKIQQKLGHIDSDQKYPSDFEQPKN